MCLSGNAQARDASRASRRFLGSVNFNATGKKRASKSQQQTAVGFERRQLAQLLRDQAAERHPDRIRFAFDRKCAGGDLEGGSVTFQQGGSDELVTERFDLLLGADGQNSRVRALLEDQVRHTCLPPHDAPVVACAQSLVRVSG